MKKNISVFFILSLFMMSCKNDDSILYQSSYANEKGPLIDKIIFEVRTDMTIAIKDVAEGRADLMSSGVDGSIYLSLSQRDRSRIETYTVPSGSWSLLFNPIPNEAPYIVVTKDGKTNFNPLAIKEIRYALNFLIDRKKIVDEILRGAGEVSFTQATPGQPGTYRYNLMPLKMGMTPTGDEAQAISDIENAMNKASNLSDNIGRLVKDGKWWIYDGKPVTIKFVIRVDDPSGRLPLGNAISDLIEKTGIKVDKLLYDRNKASQVVYNSDPGDYGWNIITEAWGAGATRAWWDVVLRQMYVREGNYMPGANVSEFWNYDNREASRISDRNSNGWFLTSEEYWNGNMRLQEIGLNDSIRIFLNNQIQFFVANKNRFNRRMLYGTGDGINDWSLRSADVKPNKNGEKILRVVQHSAQGALFISPWDPVGVGGFSDAYSAIIIGACTDAGATFESPSTARDEYILGYVDTNTLEIGVTRDSRGVTKPLGTIDVPKEAIMYNPYTGKWEEGLTIISTGNKIEYKKSDNLKAYIKGVFKPKFFRWHHGIESTMADLIYGNIFVANIITKTNENDKYYDSALAGRYSSAMDEAVGNIINEDSFVIYGKYYWPMDLDRQMSFITVSPKIGNPNRNTLIPLEINEAIMRLVTEGSKSGNVYTIAQDQSMNSIDVKNPTCVSDIRDKLLEMKTERYVPIGIERWLTVEEALLRYDAAINFIDKYGHVYISNGPFFISKIDTKANYIELTAFRDYEYSPDYWIKRLSVTMSRIEDIDMPSIVNRGEDMNINIFVSSYNYPDIDLELPDDKTAVKVSLQLPNNMEKAYSAELIDDVFKLTIKSDDLISLPKGEYILVVESRISDETPSVETRTFALR